MIFEVVANGFDANTDDTDGRVVWVSCYDKKQVLDACSGTNAKVFNLDSRISEKEVDYFLPCDKIPLQQFLNSFE